MKKIAILSLLVLTSIVTNGQENVKKCITTRLVEQELISNPDYTKGRISSINENIDWINFSAVPLSAALFECSGHITVDSAASVDAAQNGVPTLLVSCPGWSDKAKVYDYFGEYIAADIMKFTEASELSSRSLDFFTEKGAGSKSDSNSDSETAFRKFIESVRATG